MPATSMKAITTASLVILFLFATAPVASHLIARAAFVAGTPFWERTSRDDEPHPECKPLYGDGEVGFNEAGDVLYFIELTDETFLTF